MDITAARCPICLNRGRHARDGFGECSHCGLEIADDAAAGGIRQEIAAMLSGGRIGVDRSRRWRLQGGAWRNAAWALGFVLDGDRAAPARRVSHAVTLGVIGRPGDLDTIAALGKGFAQVVAVLDGEGDGSMAEVGPGLQVARCPLDGDFGAQRNRVQALVQSLAQSVRGTRWVLQLDTDERPDQRLLGALGWLTEAADRDGLRSLGLARRNLVDGVLSSLYPDIQYRLNRSDVRFEGRLHERPVVPFVQSSLALVGDIEHRLSRARVLARSVDYEAMRPGAGRTQDERALLEPFAQEGSAVR